MMTASRSRRGRALRDLRLLAVVYLLASASPLGALELDDDGHMRLGMRAYTAVRLGTEHVGGGGNPLSFPRSGLGHVRQNRFFLQLDLDHDLTSYANTGHGLARALGWMDLDVLKYQVTYRGTGEGIYTYGPSEYSDYRGKLESFRRQVPRNLGALGVSRKLEPAFIDEKVDRLNDVGRQRHQLFYAYVDAEKGPFFVRVGRQVLAWGETDVFRLLDNINPLDDSFGGFFIPLDERRVPLDMVRTSWNFGSFGPFSDAFFEGFVAQGNKVAVNPGIPEGSPWNPGGLSNPNPALKRVIETPGRGDVRGGGRFVFNFQDVTWTVAHYVSYLDVPGVKFIIPGQKNGSNVAGFSNPIQAVATAPRTSITGASGTFALPKFYSIVRSEMAYINDEPMNRQGSGNPNDNVFALGTPQARRLRGNLEGGLDPFLYPAFLDLSRANGYAGSTLKRDTFNVSLGLDVNRYVHFLNPNQSFFITTQVFYRHVFDSPGDLVLPVPYKNIGVNDNAPLVGVDTGGCGGGTEGANGRKRNCKLRPVLYPLNGDRILQTLLITTAYAGGRLVPQIGMFYDWQGAVVIQPGLTIIRDPFRFVTDYTGIYGNPTGQFGAVRDRDTMRFQVEYVF